MEQEEDQSEMSQRGATSEDERMNISQASSTIECHDDTSGECEAEARPSPMEMELEEKAFVSSLYSFMKDRGTPIERIPHLGFKQINLWRIYKAVEKLGGYESVTSRRLWKNVYDELGGSPGSTSAATCTRRHYERLVLPFERSLRGEEDRPLPASKPQKQYKRNSDGKISKPEGKRKRTQSDRDTDSEALEQTEAASQCETGTHALPSAWTIAPDRPHPPDVSQPNRGADNLSAPVHAYSHQVSTQCPWSGYSSSAVAGEVISPLEKKKRVAQASLGLPPSPHCDEKDRPSVIHSSQSPGLAYSSRNCNSPEGSPLPLSSSSSSSRSPSPYSVSSEDSLVLTEDKPGSNAVLPANSSRIINDVSGCSEENKRLSCSPKSKDLTGEPKDVPYVCSGSRNKGSFKGQSKDPGWRPSSKLSSKNPTHLWPSSTSASFPIKSDWIPASTSSFTKVMPKAVQPLRPIPFPPSYKLHQSRSVQHDDSLACAKKLHNMSPWFHHTEKREKARTTHAKPLTSTQQQHPLSHSHAGLPVSYYLAGYDRSGRDSRNQTPIPPPAFIHSRMRLPLSHPVYRHVPVGPAHSALIGSAIYSYPYHIPVWGHPQTAYSLPESMYPHKL